MMLKAGLWGSVVAMIALGLFQMFNGYYISAIGLIVIGLILVISFNSHKDESFSGRYSKPEGEIYLGEGLIGSNRSGRGVRFPSNPNEPVLITDVGEKGTKEFLNYTNWCLENNIPNTKRNHQLFLSACKYANE